MVRLCNNAWFIVRAAVLEIHHNDERLADTYFMQKLTQLIDSLSDRLGKTFAWLTLIMVVVMALIVLLRYVFQIGSIGLQESVIYINALIITFGVAYTLKEQGHVRVDIFYSRLNGPRRAWIDLVGTLVFLIPACGFIVWVSWDYVSVSWRIREGSAESSGLPYVYLLKSAILLLPCLLLLQGVSEAIKSVVRIRRRDGQ